MIVACLSIALLGSLLVNWFLYRVVIYLAKASSDPSGTVSYTGLYGGRMEYFRNN